jgi:hypothetical protein
MSAEPEKKKALDHYNQGLLKMLGGQSRNRTKDTRIFNSETANSLTITDAPKTT